jgi:hypothetical protein
MSKRILVATRKGLFDVRRAASGWRISRTAFLGDILSQAMRDPRDGTLYVAQSLGHFGVKLPRIDPGFLCNACRIFREVSGIVQIASAATPRTADRGQQGCGGF